MTVEYTGSRVPRWQLGRMLRELRTEAGITLDGATEALECSRQKVWRIERGLGSVRGLDVRAMCLLYGASAELTDALCALAVETRAKGWWHAYDEFPSAWFDLHGGLESAARSIREHADTLVPELLQVPGYALGLHEHDPELTDDRRERLVGERRRRQSLLRRRIPPPPSFDVVLSEAVLLRVVGGPATMVDQLRHLVEVGRLPHVSVRVVPLAAGPHLGAVGGAFTLFTFAPGKRAEPEPPVVHQRSLTGALYLDRPAELAAFERVWADLDVAALDEERSRHLVEKTAEEAYHG